MTVKARTRYPIPGAKPGAWSVVVVLHVNKWSRWAEVLYQGQVFGIFPSERNPKPCPPEGAKENNNMFITVREAETLIQSPDGPGFRKEVEMVVKLFGDEIRERIRTGAPPRGPHRIHLGPYGNSPRMLEELRRLAQDAGWYTKTEETEPWGRSTRYSYMEFIASPELPPVHP
jgi:hypothetical protein